MRSRSSVWTERTLLWAWRAGCSLLPCSHRCVVCGVYSVGWVVGWGGAVFDSVSCCDALHHSALSSNLFRSLLVLIIYMLHCSALSLPPSFVSHHTLQHDQNTKISYLTHASPHILLLSLPSPLNPPHSRTPHTSQLNDLRRQQSVIFIVATNRLRSFDAAVTRPGRFDFLLFVGTPNLVSREKRLVSRLEGTRLPVAKR
jgi:hypothetical protein